MRQLQTYWTVARTQADVDAAQRLRWQVAAEEMGIARVDGVGVERDVSVFDTLITTYHVLVRSGDRTVGTARLAIESADVARRAGTAFGFEMEREFELTALRHLGHPIAEVARVFISREWRASSAVSSLYEGLYATSLQLGVRYWVGAVDCQTSSREEAERMHTLLERRGLALSSCPVLPRHDGTSRSQEPSDGQAPAGSASTGDRSASHPAPFRLATTLTSFTRRLAAHCVGKPSRHPVFPRMVMPMLADLDALPRGTLARFEPSLRALHSPSLRGPEQANRRLYQ